MPGELIPVQMVQNRGIYVTYGRTTGRAYVFGGSGAITPVHPTDLEELLSRRTPPACCGARGEQPIFQICNQGVLP